MLRLCARHAARFPCLAAVSDGRPLRIGFAFAPCFMFCRKFDFADQRFDLIAPSDETDVTFFAIEHRHELAEAEARRTELALFAALALVALRTGVAFGAALASRPDHAIAAIAARLALVAALARRTELTALTRWPELTAIAFFAALAGGTWRTGRTRRTRRTDRPRHGARLELAPQVRKHGIAAPALGLEPALDRFVNDVG